MKREKLTEIKNMIPVMKNMVDEDMAISVWDREGTVLFFEKAESFPLHFDIGFKLEDKNDKIFRAMETGKKIHNILPKEVFGLAIEGNLVPIFDEGIVVGCIACVFSVEENAEFEKKKNEMKNILEESKESIYEILQSVLNTSEHIKKVDEYMNNLDISVNGVNKVVADINGNTGRTKMLALNASIEAARAGESGRGFSIVANEMGKLSQMSAESVANINKTLEEMLNSINDVRNSINSIDKLSFKNSDVVEKIFNDLNRVLE